MQIKKYKKEWLKAAGIRAIKTVVQTLVSTLTIGTTTGQIDLLTVFSISLMAGITSILTSIAGLPEVKKDDNKEVENIVKEEQEDKGDKGDEYNEEGN